MKLRGRAGEGEKAASICKSKFLQRLGRCIESPDTKNSKTSAKPRLEHFTSSCFLQFFSITFLPMINLKQQELIDQLLREVKEKFPEVDFINVTRSPENPEDLWLNVTSPEDEDREIELGEFASEKTTDILLDYGYLILVMPREKEYLAYASNGN